MKWNPGELKHLLFSLYKELMYQSCVFFRRSVTTHHCVTKLSGAIAASTSNQVRSSAMLVLPIVGN
jgi:hypothetical protein